VLRSSAASHDLAGFGFCWVLLGFAGIYDVDASEPKRNESFSLDFPFLDITWPSLGHEDDCLDITEVLWHVWEITGVEEARRPDFQSLCVVVLPYEVTPGLCRLRWSLGRKIMRLFSWILRDFLRPDVRDLQEIPEAMESLSNTSYTRVS
jgi:hypothetical protein